MKDKLLTPRFIAIITIILFGAFMRLIPHWPNFTPIAAMALFGGTYLSRKYLAFLLPIAAMFVSDLLLGFHSYMLAVYIAFAITVMIGFVLRRKVNVGNVIGASLASSVIFFLITNFAAWLASPIYPANAIGLMEAYIAGLAFFNDGSYGISFFLNTVLGGLFYNGLFFGVFYLARQRFPVLAKA